MPGGPTATRGTIEKGRKVAITGDIIEHLTGERFEFQKTAEDTGGELLRIEALVEPRGFAAAEHVHPKQEERFEILSGRCRFRVEGVEREAGAGEEVVIPKGVRHVWENAGDEDLRMIIEFRPALRSEEFFESYFGLGQDGKTDPKTGLPNLIRMAVLLREFSDEIHLARPPLLVQRIVFGTLALAGRLLGYRARYPYPYPARHEAPPTAR
jgi:mannose-6-phosphate isomerase-like protein (cupin superfamily)